MGGRKHKPTTESRNQVRTLSGYGLIHEHIADFLEIHKETLRRHYPSELRLGKARSIANVGRMLYQDCLVAGKAGQVSRFFYLKTQGRWRETGLHPDADFVGTASAGEKQSVNDLVLHAYSTAASPQEVCAFAGITQDELAALRDKDPKFARECDRVSAMARARIEAAFRAAAIEGDTNAARLWLERRHPDFKPNGGATSTGSAHDGDDDAGEHFQYL